MQREKELVRQERRKPYLFGNIEKKKSSHHSTSKDDCPIIHCYRKELFILFPCLDVDVVKTDSAEGIDER